MTDESNPLLTVTQSKFASYLLNLPFTSKHLLLLTSSVLIYFSQGCQVICYNILIPVLKEEFASYSKHLITSISSVIFIGFLLGTFFVGKVTEKLARRIGILMSLSAIAFFGTVIAVFDSLIAIFVFRMVIGSSLSFVSYCGFSVNANAFFRRNVLRRFTEDTLQ